MSVYCTQGHENLLESRFCMHCGEKLSLASGNGLYSGQMLGDRYSIVRLLAQGGFGRTYLAEDTNRFRELCVLKEFAPQAQSNTLLRKAAELFEREAGVLYKLQHPQIPRFRELFRVKIDSKEHLFLVQDYVEGETYRSLLDERMQQGKFFSETEIVHLLQQILPVLDYIHSVGVIHRDISPENLILRASDRLPMLIDFGGVKQVVATVSSAKSGRGMHTATLLGKVGYAPPEQMQQGVVYPHSDLYALAATVLVLLTGKEPQELIDDRHLTWHWRREVSLTPMLGTMIDKMLSPRPSDRYHSAQHVLHLLQQHSTAATPLPTPMTVAVNKSPVAVAVKPVINIPQPVINIPKPVINFSLLVNNFPKPAINIPKPVIKIPSVTFFKTKKIWFALPIGIISAYMGWLAVSGWLQFQSNLTDKKVPQSPKVVAKPQFSAAEQRRKNQLRDRRQRMGINNRYYIALVDQVFWERYPQYKGRRLTANPEDAKIRADWDNLAADCLDWLQFLPLETRKRLGSYSQKDRSRWQQQLYQLNLSNRVLYDLADAAFLQMFPQQRGQNFMNKPINQVWYAIAEEKLQAILKGNAYEKIEFDSGTSERQVSGRLKSGEGKTFVAELTEEQVMQLELEADPQVLISVYSPTGKIKLMEDSRNRTWDGDLPESGFYEFVVVSTASGKSDYQLKLIISE
ncbi:MAG: Serine/threonine-protein kinase PknD [Chroococcidiopsis cubana SAG 39.79]|uniref:serine/threonine-protein kinase n=1 Tax=Chroococcidiopsis cubana TaxID=171392 RepID=UPI000D056C6A|nr:serine/threonine-protein kinase [Chroococcidiopsis cubana]MDZ4875642.1 Serine/threonine-protein kinase PknD [Chroococcidiopsis cubana SAG 39.79]PSB62193.1 serine/threonine protein kinase [Chroococcidiopsis cubana CCALA 043]